MSQPRSGNNIFDRARSQIESQMKQIEDERRRTLMKKRLEFIMIATKAFHQKKMAEAVVHYRGYLKLLEESKGVGEGGLMMSHFDVTKEMGELLMLVGIYWELTKLFDRTDSPEKKREFLHYLEKFIAFSKGTSWQPLCAEQLRRYLTAEKPKHRAEFKNAYKVLGDGKCFVVTSLMDVTEFETLPALWKFRDETLARSQAGRAFIRIYYLVGPSAAAILDRLPHLVRKKIGSEVDRLARRIRSFY